MNSPIANLAQRITDDSLLSLDCILADYEKSLSRHIKEIGPIIDIAIVKHLFNQQWMMILPDVSGMEFWRTQTFDLNGFSGHMVHNSMDIAIRHAVSCWFRIRDDAALNRLQNTPEFEFGQYYSEQIGFLKERKIDFAEFNLRVTTKRLQMIENRTV